MKISDSGLNLIKEHEGLRLTAYPDPGTGGEPWTIGYGHTGNVLPGQTITQEEADYFLRNDVSWAEDCINESVDVALTQGQFDSLVSLVYNIGCKAFKGSTLLNILNTGNYSAASQQFGRWNKSGGSVLAGLTKRRKAEAELFSA